MAADHESERRVAVGQRMRVGGLEADARSERGAARPRALEMRLLEVDAEQRRARELRGQARGQLAGATADVEHRSVDDGMAVEDRFLLRPDCFDLRGEVPHHRLIGHLFRLHAARMHGEILGGDDDIRCHIFALRSTKSRSRSSADWVAKSLNSARPIGQNILRCSCDDGPATAICTVPTGFSGVPPLGPAMPVTPMPYVAPQRSRMPRASATATGSETSPCWAMSAGSTPAMAVLSAAV